MTGYPLLRLDLPDSSVPTTSLRHVSRRAALLLGLDDLGATRVSTAVSELSRLAGARRPLTIALSASIAPIVASGPPQLTVRFGFAGAGDALAGQPAVHAALARLVDTVEVSSEHVAVAAALPRPLDTRQLAVVRDDLLRESAADHGALLQSLNDELVHALDVLRDRETELVNVNTELDQTNRGVIALYAELEQRSTEVRNAQRAVFQELESALRPPPPQVARLAMAVRYVPAQANSPTGGDLYDWFVMPDGRVHITVVDVRGHGVTGTRDALHVTHAVRTLALEGHDIGQLLGRVDSVLHAAQSHVVATALVVQIDAASGTVHVAAAGHPPMLRVPAHGDASFVEAPGRPIGYEGGGSRAVSTVELAPNETVLLYTDGLIEIRHDVLEGLDTLTRAAGRRGGLPLRALLDSTLAACQQGDDLDDDTLLLAARWTP